MAHKKTLCVDFDGVLHSYKSGWEGPGVVSDAPVPGAMEFLHEAIKYFRVCIYSSRSATPQGIAAMQNWVEGHAVQCAFDNGRQWWLQIEWPIHKPAAFLSIDDRVVCFDGSWPSMAQLMGFEPWYRVPKLGQKALSSAVDLLKKGEV